MKKLLYSALLLASLSSCGIYTKYQPQTKVPDRLYGDSVMGKSITEYQGENKGDTAVADSVSLGFMDWHDLFRDSRLQILIEQALANNTDYQSAQLRVDEAAATLKAAKLAYLPSFALGPQASVSSFNNQQAVQTYSVPLTMSWEIDIFGRLRNAKEQSKALLAKSKDYRQAVRTQLIASVANLYYTLQTLDEQLRISRATESAWQETLVTARALMKAGRYNEAGVSQMEATMHSVHTSVVDLESQIAQTENSLSILLCETPRQHARNKTDSSCENIQMPEKLAVGIPLQILSSRPDVRQAERSLESAFYGVNLARSSFYPSLTLSGSVGWTNSGGTVITNPGRLLASALGSLTAPLLTKGQNEAQLKIAKAQQEEARLAYQQTVLNAGKEVNDLLTQWQAAREKEGSLRQQVKSLEKTLSSTQLLMKNGTNTYLEVLTARQSLLSAQLQQSANRLTEIQSVINLYQALGGGQEK